MDADLVTTNFVDLYYTPISTLTAAWFVPGNLDEVFAIRNESQVYHFDGVEWSFMTGLSERLIWVGGTSASDVYVIGVNTITGDGVMHHYDGTQWSLVTLPAGSKGLIDIAFPPTAPLAASSPLARAEAAESAPVIAGIIVGETGTIIMRKLLIVATIAYIVHFAVQTAGTIFLELAPTVPGQIYGIETTDDLESTFWTEVTNNIPGTGEAIFINLSFIPNMPILFLRAFTAEESPEE